MDPLTIAAASGMKARMESLDMLANNIANSGTTAFKMDREFYNLYHEELPLIERQWTDYSQGRLNDTANPLNLGLSGQGFFALNGPSGTIYTRNGDFQLSKAGILQTREGYTLRNVRDRGLPITVDPDVTINIDKDGVVRQAGEEIGQLQIDALGVPALINKLGTSYFTAQGATPARATDVEVVQGTLEQSNVPVAESAVRLVNVMRQFEMLQKALGIGAEMNKRALDEVARVS